MATGLLLPNVIDGPLYGDTFKAYVENVLAPELK